MYRYERPQKGRLRQFHQFGAESFGESSYYEDGSIIKMIADIFDFFGITYTIKLNSLGCPECMPHYKEKLVTFLNTIQNDLCDDCKRRISTNPLRVLDCKIEKCQTLLANAPLLSGHLCNTCETEINGVKSVLDRHNLSYVMDSKLVRGLDYYSKTAFEFTSDAIGSQSAIAGGGRYDRLVEFLDGKPTPAIGFAIGIERIFDLLPNPHCERSSLYVGSMTPEASQTLFDLVLTLRKTHCVETSYETKSLKAHLKNADRAHARYALIVGDDEWKEQKIWVKDLVTKEDKMVPLHDIVENFSKGIA
jgi:histidyl-tRNA synthetase